MVFIILLLLFNLNWSSSSVREEEMVESWAATLGDELWDLGTSVTKSPEIRSSYTKLNARVLPTDGEGILHTILTNVGHLLQLKMDSVRCLINIAEELYKNTTGSEDLENYTFYSSTYSPIVNDLGETREFDRDDEIEINMSFYKEIHLREEIQLYSTPVNTSYSSVYLPVDVYDQGNELLSSIYWSEGLDEKFVNNYVSDSTASWQYFCDDSGMLRHFPALHWYGEDETFDCRARYWFNEAAACSKDVAILIDHSGSMNDVKKTIAKITVQNILKTFTNNDFINIMTYNKGLKEIVPCFPQDTLVQATPENLRLLEESIAVRTPDDKADTANALIKTFSYLESRRAMNNCSKGQCSQAIILITDGIPDNMTDLFEKYNFLGNKSVDPVQILVYMVGREATNLELTRFIASQNKGISANIKYIEEVRNVVLKYVPFLGLRNIEDAALDRPLYWTHIFSDAMVGSEHESSKSRIVTTVSGPVLNLKDSESKKSTYPIGVIGTDVLIDDIIKLTLPYKIGANGYAFLLTRNGYLAFHPDLRHEENGELKENFNSVDLSEIEMYDDDVSDPRVFNPLIMKLRDVMIEQEEGSMLDMKMKFPYDNMKRVGAETRNYYFGPVNSTPFSLGLVLPYSYGSYWIKAGDEIKKSIQMGIPLIDHFKGNWRIHPDWVYCDYHKTSLWFESQEAKLSHFLEKMFEAKNWKWKEQFPEHLFQSHSFQDQCYREPIEMEEYYCDKDLMQLLVFDAKVTENSYKDSQWFAKDRKEEELVKQFGVSVRFVATQSGLTRWQHIPELPFGSRSFGEKYPLSLEESWYKSAVLFHDIDPDSFVFSTPYDAGLMSDSLVTASYAIFPRDGGHEAPGSVVGFQMQHEALFNRFIDITSKTKCRECIQTCASDSLDCYAIDSNGYIILSETVNDTGKFFGELEGAVMEAMVSRNIFRRVPMFDYQGQCIYEVPASGSAEIFKSPFILAKNIVLWMMARMLWLLVEMSQWLPVYAQLNDDYDLIMEKTSSEVISNVKPAVFKKKEEFEYIVENCDKLGYLYLLQHPSDERDNPAVSVNCSRPFYVKRIPRTNLLLVVVNTQYQSCYRRLSAHMERIIYNNPVSQEPACQKLNMTSLPRKQQPCSFNKYMDEMESTSTARKLFSHSHSFLFLLLIIVKLQYI